ncbi:hypothetical protein CMI48_01340 [Candidatus Pacearchaeota archaeon]|jgi:DNA-directed RNA polymerase alpha subunit|nr:hypothetical protein [Candidatus Pacearchaeota archaeon]
MAASITTIKLQKKTKKRLEKIRTHSRESYEELLQKLLDLLNSLRADPDQAYDQLRKIEKQHRELRKE